MVFSFGYGLFIRVWVWVYFAMLFFIFFLTSWVELYYARENERRRHVNTKYEHRHIEENVKKDKRGTNALYTFKFAATHISN